MEYVKALDTAALPAGKMAQVTVAGHTLMLANVDGTYYALADKCPHLGGSLSHGTLEGSVVRCPNHGSKYDVKTGQNVGDAQIAFVKIKVKNQQTYPVKVDGSSVLVGI